jgi:murein DD-endopeptidase MepM/ murein hydrolase activator NlpD
MKMRFCRSILFGAMLLQPLSCFAAGSEPAMPSNLAVDVAVPTSPTPVKASGAFHAVYELRLISFSSHQLHLREVDVTAISGTESLARYEGQNLIDALGQPVAPADPADKRAIGAGMSVIVYLDVKANSREAIPSALSHRLVFEPVQGLTEADTTISDIRVAVKPQAPIVLEPPLRGGGWIASHAWSNTSEHRRSMVFVNGKAWIAQRFAIDWIRIGPNGQAFQGDPAKNRNWAPYGAEFLAVAAGRVSDVKDGIAENDPTSDTKAVPINLETAGGNYIILDLGGGRYAFYAHLQPASLRVRIGDRVRPGQVIARLGDSGNADAPHLHFQIMDANAPLAADGLPYVFRKFRVEGTLPSLRILADGEGWRPVAAPVDIRANELPTENEVIDFTP